jgi:hypothetical protein
MTETNARCAKPGCAYPMPHEHTVGTASAGPPPPTTVTFTTLLNDPTQQLDTEGVVLASVLNEQERDRLRSEGWRACVEHLQQRYNRRADTHPVHVPYVMLDGEDLWFLANVHNPFKPRVLPPGESA